MTKKYQTAPAPHIKTQQSVSGIFWNSVLALIPVYLVFIIHKPLETLRTSGLVLSAGLLTEVLTALLLKKKMKISDGSTVLYSLLLVLMIPFDAGIVSVLTASVVTVFLGKELYGGKGNLWVHPSALGIAFFVLNSQGFELPGTWAFAFWNPFTDLWSGLITLALLTGGIVKIVQKNIFWKSPLIYLAGVLIPCQWMGIHTALSLPLLFLNAFWMIPDSAAAPSVQRAKIYFAVAAAVLTLLFDLLSVPLAPVFALLLMNLLTPWIDEWLLPGGIAFESKVQPRIRV